MIEISGWFLSHHISCQSDPNVLTILVTVSRNFQVFPDILNAKEKMRMRILIVEDEKDLGMSCPKCWNWKDTTRISPMTENTDWIVP